MGLSDVGNYLREEMQDTQDQCHGNAASDEDEGHPLEAASAPGRHQSGREPEQHAEQRHKGKELVVSHAFGTTSQARACQQSLPGLLRRK
jgi:hypothetical protein